MGPSVSRVPNGTFWEFMKKETIRVSNMCHTKINFSFLWSMYSWEFPRILYTVARKGRSKEGRRLLGHIPRVDRDGKFRHLTYWKVTVDVTARTFEAVGSVTCFWVLSTSGRLEESMSMVSGRKELPGGWQAQRPLFAILKKEWRSEESFWQQKAKVGSFSWQCKG